MSAQIISHLTSRTIALLRFPLAIGVVMIHSNINVAVTVDSVGTTMASALRYFFCSDLPRCCVPLFFVISGLLLFRGGEIHWFTDSYKSKIRSRTKSLLIPYLFWNFCLLILFSARTVIEGRADGEFLASSLISAFIGKSPGEGVSILTPFQPADFPLWFIRDLYILVLLSPIVSAAVRRLGLIPFLLCCGFMIADIWVEWPVLNIQSVTFFCLGAWLGIKKIDPCSIVLNHRKLSTMCIILWILMMFVDVTVWMWNPEYYYIPHVFQILISVPAVFAIFTRLANQRPNIKSPVSSSCVFAIFVLQGVFSPYLRLFAPLFNCNTFLGTISYCTFMFIGMIAGSIAVWMLANKICPKLSRLIFAQSNPPAALK